MDLTQSMLLVGIHNLFSLSGGGFYFAIGKKNPVLPLIKVNLAQNL